MSLPDLTLNFVQPAYAGVSGPVRTKSPTLSAPNTVGGMFFANKGWAE